MRLARTKATDEGKLAVLRVIAERELMWQQFLPYAI